jgi:hypothetical protein
MGGSGDLLILEALEVLLAPREVLEVPKLLIKLRPITGALYTIVLCRVESGMTTKSLN